MLLCINDYCILNLLNPHFVVSSLCLFSHTFDVERPIMVAAHEIVAANQQSNDDENEAASRSSNSSDIDDDVANGIPDDVTDDSSGIQSIERSRVVASLNNICSGKRKDWPKLASTLNERRTNISKPPMTYTQANKAYEDFAFAAAVESGAFMKPYNIEELYTDHVHTPDVDDDHDNPCAIT